MPCGHLKAPGRRGGQGGIATEGNTKRRAALVAAHFLHPLRPSVGGFATGISPDSGRLEALGVSIGAWVSPRIDLRNR